MLAVFQGLHAVVNSGPSTVGGGGTPRQQPPPPICGDTTSITVKSDDTAVPAVLAAPSHAPSLEIIPATSAAEPLITRSLQFTATRNAEDANRTQYYLIETVNASSHYTTLSMWLCAGSESPTMVVAPLIDTTSNGPSFPSMDVVSSVQVRVSTYDAKDGECLGVSALQTIHFDLRYSTLTHQIMVKRQAHNRVHLTAVPEDAALAQMTKSFTFDTFTVGKSRKWTTDTLYKQ